MNTVVFEKILERYVNLLGGNVIIEPAIYHIYTDRVFLDFGDSYFLFNPKNADSVFPNGNEGSGINISSLQNELVVSYEKIESENNTFNQAFTRKVEINCHGQAGFVSNFYLEFVKITPINKK